MLILWSATTQLQFFETYQNTLREDCATLQANLRQHDTHANMIHTAMTTSAAFAVTHIMTFIAKRSFMSTSQTFVEAGVAAFFNNNAKKIIVYSMLYGVSYMSGTHQDPSKKHARAVQRFYQKQETQLAQLAQAIAQYHHIDREAAQPMAEKEMWQTYAQFFGPAFWEYQHYINAQSSLENEEKTSLNTVSGYLHSCRFALGLMNPQYPSFLGWRAGLPFYWPHNHATSWKHLETFIAHALTEV